MLFPRAVSVSDFVTLRHINICGRLSSQSDLEATLSDNRVVRRTVWLSYQTERMRGYLANMHFLSLPYTESVAPD